MMQRKPGGDRPVDPERRGWQVFCEPHGVSPEYGGLTARPWQPAADIYETAEAIVLKMDIAGLDPESTDVLLHGNTIVVRGRRCDTTPGKTAIHHMEISYGRFERRFVVDVPFDADGVEAGYDGGFLRVWLPKAAHRTRKRVRVTIHL